MLKFYCSIHTVTKQGHTAGRKNMLWYCTAARQGEVCKKKNKKKILHYQVEQTMSPKKSHQTSQIQKQRKQNSDEA